MNQDPAQYGAICSVPAVPPDPARVIFLVFAGKKHFPPPLGGDGGQEAGEGGLAGWRGGGVAGWLVGLVGLVGLGGSVGLAGWAG